MSHGSVVPELIITKGMRLQSARKHAGITQESMADMLGCARRTITRWETEQGAPPAVVMAYSVATDVNLGWLETGTADFIGDGGEFLTGSENVTVLDTTKAGRRNDRPSPGKLLHLDSNQEPIGSESSGESNVLRVQFGRRAEDEMQRAA